MQITRAISVGTIIQISVLLVGLSGAYFALKYDIADAGETAEQAEKLSAKNTTQISDLKEIVNKLVTAVQVQNETISWQYQIQSNDVNNLKDRLKGVEGRMSFGPN